MYSLKADLLTDDSEEGNKLDDYKDEMGVKIQY